MSSPFELRWGILSTGSIAAVFAKDLLIDTRTRGVQDVTHRIVAVGSRSAESASRFIMNHLGDNSSIQAIGSYEELYKSDDVDILYIATPHSHHYENVRVALEHGKNVCLEKPATVNAKQWRALTQLAQRKRCFLMEAVWTRFFPLVHHYQSLISKGVIGDVEHIYAELCIQRPLYDAEAKGSVLQRLVDPNLASGSLLDQGPYPLLHALMAAPRNNEPKDGDLPLPRITSCITKMLPEIVDKYGGGDADESAFATLLFPTARGRMVPAEIVSSFVFSTPADRAVSITGTKGRIVIPFPTYRPTRLIVEACETESAWRNDEKPSFQETKDFPIPGGAHGMMWEADECARCIRDGNLQSERISWRETALTMDIFDEIRRQNDFHYPSAIEAM